MNKLVLLLFFIGSCMAWDYLMFVQYWPTTWINRDHIKNTNFTNDHFNVHGIWPQYNNGSYPQFCNKTVKFDPSQLAPIRSDLAKYWTDYHNGERFLMHEFYRHATCAETDSLLNTELKFFGKGLDFRTKHNLYQYLTDNHIYPSNNQTYNRQEIYDAIQKNIPTNIAMTCPGGILDSVMICTDAGLNLINCPVYLNTCRTNTLSYNFINY